MADLNARDLKLVQYLNEAYGKERQLETALTAHIAIADAAKGAQAYAKKLREHLKETQRHAREVQRRITKLGGTAETIDLPGPAGTVAGAAVGLGQRAAAAAAGPLHALRGTGEQEKLLKNAKTEYQDEFEEIATYYAIEEFANAVGDKETASLARAIRKEEERMARFLERLIPRLAKAVAKDEVPAALRNGGSRRRASSSRKRSSASKSRTTKSRGGAKRTTAKKRTTTAKKRTTTAKKRTTTAKKRATTRRSSARKTTGARSTKSRSTTKRASKKSGATKSRSR